MLLSHEPYNHAYCQGLVQTDTHRQNAHSLYNFKIADLGTRKTRICYVSPVQYQVYFCKCIYIDVVVYARPKMKYLEFYKR